MDRFFGALVLFLFVTPAIAENNCSGCTSASKLIFNYELRESPDNIDGEDMELYFWSVVSVMPTYDLRNADEPFIGCQVTVDLVQGEHPALLSLKIGELSDGGAWLEQIYFGIWMPIDDFENRLVQASCRLAAT